MNLGILSRAAEIGLKFGRAYRGQVKSSVIEEKEKEGWKHHPTGGEIGVSDGWVRSWLSGWRKKVTRRLFTDCWDGR
jgi:hypothetical protein